MDAPHSPPPAHAQIPPPPHPTYDLIAAVQQALDEDAGILGDVTSLATYAMDVRWMNFMGDFMITIINIPINMSTPSHTVFPPIVQPQPHF